MGFIITIIRILIMDGMTINHIYIYIWVNYNDLTVLPHWNHGFYMGNHSQMAARFRFVNYYSLPRYIYIYIDIHIYTYIDMMRIHRYDFH